MRHKWIKYLLIITCTIIVLSGCSNSTRTFEDTYIAETDFPYYFQTVEGNMKVTKSEKGYYLLNGRYIYFMEEEGEPILLDQRPNNECKENTDGKNCNAFIRLDRGNSPLFQFYNDKLYVLEYIEEIAPTSPDEPLIPAKYQLLSMDQDGSNRKILRELNHPLISSAAIHRGDLYYGADTRDIEGNNEYNLFRQPLNKMSSEPEVLYKGEHKNGGIHTIIPYGAQVYFYEFDDYLFFQNKRYDLNDATVTTLWEDFDKAEGFKPNLETVHNNQLYFWNAYYDGRLPEEVAFDERSLVVYKSDLDGSNIQETNIQSADMMSKIQFDQRYTYVAPVWFQLYHAKKQGVDTDLVDETNVYKDDELIHVIDTSAFSNNRDYTTGDERYMFLMESDLENQRDDDYEIHEMYYLDKNEIESGQAQFKLLLKDRFGLGHTLPEGW